MHPVYSYARAHAHDVCTKACSCLLLHNYMSHMSFHGSLDDDRATLEQHICHTLAHTRTPHTCLEKLFELLTWNVSFVQNRVEHLAKIGMTAAECVLKWTTPTDMTYIQMHVTHTYRYASAYIILIQCAETSMHASMFGTKLKPVPLHIAGELAEAAGCSE